MVSHNQESNSKARTLITFSCSAIAIGFLVAATQVEMPLKAILIAIAFSEITFLILLFLGKILPDKRK